MKLLADWGFSKESWRGTHGEYWVVGQAIVLMTFLFLPIYRPPLQFIPGTPAIYFIWAIAAFLGVLAITLLTKGLIDLGQNLTPLPFPKADGQLTETGAYSLVRHPLYSGLIILTLAWALYVISLSHLLCSCILFLLLDRKAAQEEMWLTQKYPEYENYRHRVKKLIPWVY
ncbi:MAG TPA: isoprenylcysteine carboxylmethyltransferase family protein [Leptolyngbyaceae cyanobacterium M33_DOE_097]|uniref:Isoprenylcysteine carboxylmethyltransferase family protein n=1 Tax=Oscillatoriales cyanobacterium SpSt-418 TaxID=2282169 RepID=A0A7C3PU68_9CYAN|nr:isoprenylcysteine carboxylmethyltransferase family protein [Leptolyngbyaceae cyanobacterium M33_DOE_097]